MELAEDERRRHALEVLEDAVEAHGIGHSKIRNVYVVAARWPRKFEIEGLGLGLAILNLDGKGNGGPGKGRRCPG